jgi:hypothetical protein
MSVVGALLVVALLVSGQAPPSGSRAVGAPSPERWRFANLRAPIFQLDCSEESVDGSTSCRYEPRGLWRRFRNFRHSRIEDLIYFHTRVSPLQCAWGDARPFARAHLEELAGARVPDEEMAIEAPTKTTILLRSRSLRVAYVATPHDLVQIVLQVPGGIGEEDQRNFEDVIASVRPGRSARDTYRRGLWLESHRRSKKSRHLVPICGMSEEERGRRAVEELERATVEEPDDWRPWALLAQLAEERGGGRDALRDLLAGEPGSSSRNAVWSGFDSDARTAPRDPAALADAARLYLEATRRDPPAAPLHEAFFDTPLDRSTVLARGARIRAKLGQTGEARRLYRRALDLGDEGTWGSLEASFWLAEDAFRAGRLDEARHLYQTADRAWWAFHRVDWLHSEHGPALRTRIDRRLAALADDD